MREQPMLSVITICKNNEEGVSRTMNSIREQNYPNLEWIVIDGGSSDGTIERLRLSSFRPDVLISESDRGVYDAMNKGLRNATGDVLVFLNSGDTFAQESTLIRMGELWQDSDWEWAYGGQYYVDGDEVLAEMTPKDFSLRAMTLGVAFAPHQSTYMSKSLWQRIGEFDVNFEYAADQEAAIRAGIDSKPLVIKEILARFEVGGLHQSGTYFKREKIYHRIRSKHGMLIWNNTAADLALTSSIALYRETREKCADFTRRLFKLKPNKVR